MEHKVVPAYKIFEEISSDKIEKQVNRFTKCHDVESVGTVYKMRKAIHRRTNETGN